MDSADDLGTVPWPAPEADLLAEDSDWWLVACMDWPRDRWLGYVSGYWKAAGLIAVHIAQVGHDQDTLIYPFLMCWRHYVELQLKILIALLRQYHREPGPLLKTHKLDQLWKVARVLLERAFPGEDQAAIADAERVLMLLHRLDPSSENFRYPILNDGSETLPGVGRIHIRRFHEAMDGVAHFLDAADTGLRVMLDDRAEYEAEMASYPDDGGAW